MSRTFRLGRLFGGGPPPELPIPPLEMRKLVGPTDPAAFDNPTGSLVYQSLDVAAYRSVFDFGCGCGRIARQLIQQRPRPERYVGIDLHRGMVEWCRRNLAPAAPGFEFHHHDVFNYHFNPGPSKPPVRPFPVEDRSFTLVNAFSVFTHLTQRQADHYLPEVARVLDPNGVFYSTWFLFDKREFPMMQEHTNALYVSDVDPSAAVIFDKEWVRARAREAGLIVYSVVPPRIRGYQWVLLMAPAARGLPEVEFGFDTGDVEAVALPEMPPNPDQIGLETRRVNTARASPLCAGKLMPGVHTLDRLPGRDARIRPRSCSSRRGITQTASSQKNRGYDGTWATPLPELRLF